MTTINLNGWQTRIVPNAGGFNAVKGYEDRDGFTAVRSLGFFKTLRGAENAARRAMA